MISRKNIHNFSAKYVNYNGKFGYVGIRVWCFSLSELTKNSTCLSPSHKKNDLWDNILKLGCVMRTPVLYTECNNS